MTARDNKHSQLPHIKTQKSANVKNLEPGHGKQTDVGHHCSDIVSVRSHAPSRGDDDSVSLRLDLPYTDGTTWKAQMKQQSREW